MKTAWLVAGLALVLTACASRTGTPGIDYPYPVEAGSIQVTDVRRQESFTQSYQTIYPREGNLFVLVDVEVKGTVPSAGVQEAIRNLLKGSWILSDIRQQGYRPSGLVSGALIFEVRKPAAGLRLALGPSVDIPLGSFFGEEVIPVPEQNGAPTRQPLPAVSNETWRLQVLEAYWTEDVGSIIQPAADEMVLALTVDLEYVGEAAPITARDFVRVVDDRGRPLRFESHMIINNGPFPEGGNDWIAQSSWQDATRRFAPGEAFESLVLFFVGRDDAAGLMLHVDQLPPVELDEAWIVH